MRWKVFALLLNGHMMVGYVEGSREDVLKAAQTYDSKARVEPLRDGPETVHIQQFIVDCEDALDDVIDY